MTDGSGTVRARYAYDAFGRRTRMTGDVETDFGFAGMFWSPEVGLYFTQAFEPMIQTSGDGSLEIRLRMRRLARALICLPTCVITLSI